eukprot:COSAG01_NODE_4263_length_5198_cov_77.376937_3_plen_140_part_00
MSSAVVKVIRRQWYRDIKVSCFSILITPLLSSSVDPTPENLEKWLDAAYPRDSNGVSIRHQINKTMPEEQQWVDDLMAGKICPLAAAAFKVGLEFDPPPWAEKLKLALRENSPGQASRHVAPTPSRTSQLQPPAPVGRC